ncbi:erythromycin esterase family protein [Saccharothrix sp.]|uniref:erythromycin esterase family protein n=1 Tax=Saccharothrix sp. TaxID=1873460 RepID=UPI002812373B|nr:erythromycin esterase family protein [Saccharothrix sp.]
MSTAAPLRSISRQLDDLLAARTVPPAVLALGEPTHGIEAFPLLRNELLAHLVDRGFRSIALEIDFFAASLVDDHVNGGTTDIDTVLDTGFSHRFGHVPGNRQLVEWLRAHNADRPPHDRVHFYGFDAPLETAAAPSPRHALSAVLDHLPPALHPAQDLDALLGDDADWTNPEAMYDPTKSIGAEDRVAALRIVADDLASALRRAAPTLRPADAESHDLAVAHARTAQGLLRYHAAMASPSPDRIATLLSVRAEMMADNLLTIVDREQHRGPTLVFAHNVHLLRTTSTMEFGPHAATWSSAGALVALTLGERYAVVVTDANPRSEPGTLQHALAEATTRRTLFPTAELREALPAETRKGEPIVPGHLPLDPADLAGADAVVFVADTDGTRHQYW